MSNCFKITKQVSLGSQCQTKRRREECALGPRPFPGSSFLSSCTAIPGWRPCLLYCHPFRRLLRFAVITQCWESLQHQPSDTRGLPTAKSHSLALQHLLSGSCSLQGITASPRVYVPVWGWGTLPPGLLLSLLLASDTQARS